MNIVFVAKHGQERSNDEEGAVADALTRLGHTVRCVGEAEKLTPATFDGAGLVLYFKWSNWTVLKQLDERVKRAFWFFDLVSDPTRPPDPLIRQRCVEREEWLDKAVWHSDVGFVTDGDAAKRYPKHLHHLTQAADQRCVGRGKASQTVIPILFTGTRRGGIERERFVDGMASRYGAMFHHVPNGAHGAQLANLIASSMIVIAPPSPVTNLYCSNRAYLTLGYGGFLLHPRVATLAEHYADGKEIIFYDSEDHMHSLITRWLSSHPGERATVSAAGLDRTRREHTYVDRCKQLIRTVEELK